MQLNEAIAVLEKRHNAITRAINALTIAATGTYSSSSQIGGALMNAPQERRKRQRHMSLEGRRAVAASMRRRWREAKAKGLHRLN